VAQKPREVPEEPGTHQQLVAHGEPPRPAGGELAGLVA
jgi:hypothetical protein